MEEEQDEHESGPDDGLQRALPPQRLRHFGHAARFGVDAGGVEGQFQTFWVVGFVGDHLIDVDDRQVPVRDDRVAAAISGVVSGGEVLDPVDRDRFVDAGDGVDDVVAFDVGVLFDLVGELEREQGDADGFVVGSGGQPVCLVSTGQQPSVRAFPEPHVVTLTRIAVDFLLVGEVLTSAEQQQRGHRSLRVAALRHRRTDDLPRRCGSDAVGEDPPSFAHRVVDLGFLTAPGEVDRIAEQTVGGAGTADEVVRHIDLGQDAVQSGQSQVGHDSPEHEQRQHLPPAEAESFEQDQQRQPGRRRTGEEEEQVVEYSGGREVVSPIDERLPQPSFLPDRRTGRIRSACRPSRSHEGQFSDPFSAPVMRKTRHPLAFTVGGVRGQRVPWPRAPDCRRRRVRR